MIMTWTEAHKAWDTFLSEVEKTKCDLHCSYQGAWFRGHSNSTYQLNPSLFRISYKNYPQCEHTIELLENNINKHLKQYHSLKETKAQVRKELKSCSENAKDNNDDILVKTNDEYRKLHYKMIEIKKKIDETKIRIKNYEILFRGEREAFNEYSFRSGRDYRSSWETLAEMQHHGVPTRLLDWSEVLAVGLYFALNKYYKELNSYWNENKKILLPFPPDDVISIITQEPSIWVLNPYKLSEKSTGDLKIWDLTLDKRYDYFDSFLVNQNWPFDKAIPMYSPWRNARIASQQGMFTVSGHEKNSLSEQFSSKIIREVKITPMAAIYGVRMLRELLGIDNFMIFRDLDTLGAKVKKQFFE